MAAAGYPQPPGVVGQNAPAPRQSVFSGGQGQDQAPGQGQSEAMQSLQLLQQKLKGVENAIVDLRTVSDSYDKSLTTLLAPAVAALAQFEKTLVDKAQRSGIVKGSPTLTPQGAGTPPGVPPGPRGV